MHKILANNFFKKNLWSVQKKELMKLLEEEFIFHSYEYE